MSLTLLLLDIQMPLAFFLGFRHQPRGFRLGRFAAPLVLLLPLTLHFKQTRYLCAQLRAFAGQHIQLVLKILNLNGLLRHMYGCQHRDPRCIQSRM
ncbi:hypothetical protein D3C73_1251910 [compost metagenome]